LGIGGKLGAFSDGRESARTVKTTEAGAFSNEKETRVSLEDYEKSKRQDN